MKFGILSKKKSTDKATQYEIYTESGDIIDLWLPNKSVKVENDQIEIPEWLIAKNDKLREAFPDFIPTEPIKENQLDVLKDIRKILKQICEKLYEMEN